MPMKATVTTTDPVTELAALRAAVDQAKADYATVARRVDELERAHRSAWARADKPASHDTADALKQGHADLAAANAAVSAAENALRGYAPQVTREHVEAAEAISESLRIEIKRYEALIASTTAPASLAAEIEAARAERRRALADLAEGTGSDQALARCDATLKALEADEAERQRQATTAAETRAALQERAASLAVRLRTAEANAAQLATLRVRRLQVEAFEGYLAAALAVRDAWLRAEAADRYARTHGLATLADVGWHGLMLPTAGAPVGNGRPVVEGTGYLVKEIERACDDLRAALD